MNATLTDSAEAVLAQLEELERLSRSADDGDIAAKDNAKTAEERRAAIRRALDFLSMRDHPVVFIGSVGVGKSSMIGVLANLIVGQPPTNRATLRDRSVLAIGSGRTTICEVCIQTARSGEAPLRLLLEPLAESEMKREIELFAEDEWGRKHVDSGSSFDEDSDPTSLELHRAIRAMTGYAERQETYVEGGHRKRRNVWPLDEVIPKFETSSALAAHLIERANLPQRRALEWSWPSFDEESLKALKARFDAVNRGAEPSAMVPLKMTVVVPEALPGSRLGLDMRLIDTRGLDGTVESRRDLQDLLADRRAVTVLCASFKDAPDDAIRAVLRSVGGDVELRPALSNMLLVLVDQGDAEQVNGADGDREFGQQLKVDECRIVLEGVGLARALGKGQILAFDALQDNRARLVAAIDERLSALRDAMEKDLQGLLEDAQRFLKGTRNLLLPDLRQRVDARILAAFAAHPSMDAPMADPLEGAYEAIQSCRYPRVVNATCRRNGAYFRLDVYAAIRMGAALAAGSHLESPMDGATNALDALAQDPLFEPVIDHVRLRRRQLQEGLSNLVRDYSGRVESEVRSVLHDLEILEKRSIWTTCQEEWGRGPGYKNRVLEHLKDWSRRHQGLTAHEHIAAGAFLPLIGEAIRPPRAPRFTLHVRNLRALRRVEWQPNQVCALIGANGTGKTTLFEALRLLHVAYDRGLSDAVKIVMGGASNLKTWGSPDDEPVEMGVDLGDASWRIQLLAREGSVVDVTHERLTDKGREVFSRDSLGGFVYGKERIENGPYIGLRTLMDRGAHELSIRSLAKLLRTISVYRDPDLAALREGSRTTEDRKLHARGSNALTLLRRWLQEHPENHRYKFVLEGLDLAFPGRIGGLDFREAGNTLAASVVRPGSEGLSPLSDEANGVLQLLVLLCDVASAPDESVVAIDEPENGLHPYALRSFLRSAGRWARRHNLTILLATHSTVLLDELGAQPEQVYVMKAPDGGGALPTRLDELCNREWLAEYKLGDLYENGEIGSNQDLA